LEQHHLDTLGEVDILIIAVGGYYTLDADGAYTVTKKINPKLVIPCHYKTPKCGFDIATEAPFLAHFSSEKRIEPGGSFYHVTPPLTFDSTTCLHLHPRL
jgi:L-ascorbate metabolism protein UlaG (beta-lactamase superfamily)